VLTTSEVLQAKLAELLAMPRETEWVEFKHAKTSFASDDLGKYFSALSNEASLKGQPCGWLVFGIEDGTHAVLGTQFRRESAKLHQLKQEVAPHTSGLTFVEIHELVDPRVLLFEIPAARDVPTPWKGHYYGRNGESLVGLSLSEMDRIRGIDLVALVELTPDALQVLYRAVHPRPPNDDGWKGFILVLRSEVGPCFIIAGETVRFGDREHDARMDEALGVLGRVGMARFEGEDGSGRWTITSAGYDRARREGVPAAGWWEALV